MGSIKENINCYATHTQKEVLTWLITYPDIERKFFLTGLIFLQKIFQILRKLLSG
jgi:hypothetical protein